MNVVPGDVRLEDSTHGAQLPPETHLNADALVQAREIY